MMKLIGKKSQKIKLIFFKDIKSGVQKCGCCPLLLEENKEIAADFIKQYFSIESVLSPILVMTLTASDFDHDGISINTNAFALNGSTMVTVGDPGMVVQTAHSAVAANSNARVNTIDLGASGLLTHGVLVEGAWYYHWDRNGDGIANAADKTSPNVLGGIFNKDVNGALNPGSVMDSTYHFATINGIEVSVPSVNGGQALPNPITISGDELQPGTAYSDPGATTNGTASAPYNALLAVWDAHNGTGTGLGLSGVPTGWASDNYVTNNIRAAGEHILIDFSSGRVADHFDSESYYVALRVL